MDLGFLAHQAREPLVRSHLLLDGSCAPGASFCSGLVDHSVHYDETILLLISSESGAL